MGGVRRVAKARALTSFAAALVALAAAILIGIIGGKVAALPQRVTTAGDAYALTAAPEETSGTQDYLAAGGIDGGAAISYVKFDVTLPDNGQLPKRTWLWLGRHSGQLPELLELTHVPDAGWDEKELAADTAPRLGDVVAMVEPRPDAPAVAFDITSVVKKSGTFAFAITSPTSLEHAKFVAREALETLTGAPTITFDWWVDDPSESASSGPWNPPSFTPTPRTSEPVTDPWPTASPSVTESASVSPSPTGSPTPTESPSESPSPTESPSESPSPTESPSESPSPTESPSESPSPTESPSESPSPTESPSESPSASPSATESPSASPSQPQKCTVRDRLVPTCGALWGVAPGAHTSQDRIEALKNFDRLAERPQLIYHAYHRGHELFPTQAEVELTRDPDFPRILFLNWKPLGVTWAEIARSDQRTDAYLDRLAAHIKKVHPEQFFFTIHHEPENDVRDQEGSGMTAKDYAAAFRYVVKYLRGKGMTNAVTVMSYMAYIPWNTKPWFEDLYPGADVVDWVAWDIYSYSDPGYGFGDFAEMMNRRSGGRKGWPGFYNWAAKTFPDKPLMVGEWGVWYSRNNPGHHEKFFDSARLQLDLFPRVKAFVYFETPNADGRDSRIQHTSGGQRAFQKLSDHRAFDVELGRTYPRGLIQP